MVAVNTNGYTSNTVQHLLLDAGAIYKNVTFDDTTGTFDGEAMGATSGGNEYAHTQNIRYPELDGVKGDAKTAIIESERVEMVVNMKEVTAQTLKNALAGSNLDTTDTNYDILTTTGKIDSTTDYIDNITYVGKLSGSDKPVVIMMDNALSVNGLNFNPADNSEGVIPITFRGHADEADVHANKAPATIYYPKLT